MSPLPPWLRAVPGGCRLALRVQPKSSQNKIVGPEGDALKVKLHAAPEDGKANEALVDLLRALFRLPRQNIKILRGEKSRSKWVEIQGLKPEEAAAAVLSLHKS